MKLWELCEWPYFCMLELEVEPVDRPREKGWRPTAVLNSKFHSSRIKIYLETREMNQLCAVGGGP